MLGSLFFIIFAKQIKTTFNETNYISFLAGSRLWKFES